MKTFTLILLSIVLSNSILRSQDVEIFTYWHPGDTQKLIIKEGFIEYENEKVTKKEVTTSQVVITVLEETDSSYVIEWHYTGEEVDRINVDVEEDPMDEKLEQMFASTKLLFQTDEFGVFQKTLNMEELLEEAMEGLTVIIKEEMVDAEEEEVEMFLNLMQELLMTEEMQDELIRDIWNYHYYLGDIFVPDTTIQYSEEIENQLGGESIPVDGTVSISTDRDQWTIDINDLKKFESSAINSAISDGIAQLNVPDSKELKEGLEEIMMNVRDVENYTYDFNYGWLKYYERNRITSAQNMRKENFIIMLPQ